MAGPGRRHPGMVVGPDGGVAVPEADQRLHRVRPLPGTLAGARPPRQPLRAGGGEHAVETAGRGAGRATSATASTTARTPPRPTSAGSRSTGWRARLRPSPRLTVELGRATRPFLARPRPRRGLRRVDAGGQGHLAVHAPALRAALPAVRHRRRAPRRRRARRLRAPPRLGALPSGLQRRRRPPRRPAPRHRAHGVPQGLVPVPSGSAGAPRRAAAHGERDLDAVLLAHALAQPVLGLGSACGTRGSPTACPGRPGAAATSAPSRSDTSSRATIATTTSGMADSRCGLGLRPTRGSAGW